MAKNIKKIQGGNINLFDYGIVFVTFFSIAIFVGMILYFANNDNQMSLYKEYIYLFSIMLPLIFIFGFIIDIWNDDSTVMNLVIILFTIAIVTGILYLYTQISMKYLNFFSIIVSIIFSLIIFVALAIFASIYLNNAKKSNTWNGFIANMIFYLPCLFNESIAYILRELEITPNITFILLAFEFILILSYFIIPIIFDNYINKNAIVLLKNPILLDNETQLISGRDLHKTIYGEDIYNDPTSNDIHITNTQALYNYSISLWIFINPQSFSFSEAYNKETDIFKYGFNNNMKPKITYFNNGKTSDNLYKVYLTDSSLKPDYELNIPVQKWVNFVFNYNQDEISLFIDGNLERNFKFDKNRSLPIYDSLHDNIFSGANNGLNGAISNVTYYTIPLTASQIATNYNIFVTNNFSKGLKI